MNLFRQNIHRFRIFIIRKLYQKKIEIQVIVCRQLQGFPYNLGIRGVAEFLQLEIIWIPVDKSSVFS